MKKPSIQLLLALTTVFILSSTSLAYSASSLLNRPCKKVGSTTTSQKKKLTCVSVSGIKIWKLTVNSNQPQSAKALPSIAPTFSIKYESDRVYAAVIVNGQELKTANVEGAVAIIYAKIDGNYKKIGSSNWKVLAENYVAGSTTINFNWPLSGLYKGSELAVEIRYENSSGFGDKALKAIIIPTIESTPTPTPQPSQAATPVPVISATPRAEVGCSVNYLSALPYASQRIAILSMSWEKDSSGYVFANASMRNDNSMALRLVEFSFYILHKGSLVYTTSTLEGDHHFFIQGDTKFNSIDGASGAWLPGQVRTFKMPTNQMLECRSINVTSTGFNVKQGIGAS